MKLGKLIKTASLAGALGLGLTVVAPSTHAADATAASQKLVNSLKALKVDQVDYLYTYLQSVNLTDAEVNQIQANAERFKSVIGTTSVKSLTNAQKVEAARLLNESAQLAHLQLAIVDDKGNAIDLANYNFTAKDIKVVLKDLNGKILATINPTAADLQPAALASFVGSLNAAVAAKLEIEEATAGSSKLVPITGGTLPNTNSADPTYIALGALLFMLGGAGLIPAMKAVRKSEPTEA